MKMIFRGQNMLFQYALTGDQYDLLTVLWQLFCCCLYVDHMCCAHYAYYGCEYGKMFTTEKDHLTKKKKKKKKNIYLLSFSGCSQKEQIISLQSSPLSSF